MEKEQVVEEIKQLLNVISTDDGNSNDITRPTAMTVSHTDYSELHFHDGQSQERKGRGELSRVSRDETLDIKPIFLLQNCSKIHLQQCRMLKVFRGRTPGPPATREERERGRREGNGRG